MKYSVRISARFRKDMKLVQKRGYDQRLIFEVIELLANGMKLDEKYKDHLLTGDYGGFRECHITPDWLPVYQYREQELLLLLSRTGTHEQPVLNDGAGGDDVQGLGGRVSKGGGRLSDVLLRNREAARDA